MTIACGRVGGGGLVLLMLPFLLDRVVRAGPPFVDTIGSGFGIVEIGTLEADGGRDLEREREAADAVEP